MTIYIVMFKNNPMRGFLTADEAFLHVKSVVDNNYLLEDFRIITISVENN